MTEKIIPPATLLIGQQHAANNHITKYLQSFYCQKNSCNSCITCTHIKDRQYSYLHVVNHEDTIKIEHIDFMLNMIQYERENNIPFFFIMHHIDFLSNNCTNRLLKILEEMPPYYHFIFSATHEDMIHTTIKSRCFKYFVKNQEENVAKKNLFFDKKINSITEFTQFLELYNSLSLPHYLHLLNQILEHWSLEYQKITHIEEKKDAYKKITYIKKLLSKRLPEGSYNLIARDMYLEWNRHVADKIPGLGEKNDVSFFK